MTGIMPDRFNTTSAPSSFLNVGGSISIKLPNGYGIGRMLMHGETLQVHAESESDRLSVVEALGAYPDLVPVGSVRASAFEVARRAREALALAHITDEEERRAAVAEMAEAWLDEHDVPDFVVEYLRGDD